MDLYKIVADSSADLLEQPGVAFASVPLKIITADREYVDDHTLDVQEMVTTLQSYRGRSSTSCPNPEEWLQAFGDASIIFCVPITATLSGSYHTANIAKQIYEERHPDRKVFVVNTLTAGPEMRLIVEKIAEWIEQGQSYETICEEIPKYTRKTGLLFMLESMKNLTNNGRVHPLVAKAAGLLGIRAVGKASDEGNLQLLEKCRGQEKALAFMVKKMLEDKLKSGKVYIAHCLNEAAAGKFRELLLHEFADLKVEIYKCRGLCSFYAEQGGLLVGYEMC